jgi:hypothetical protein
MSEHVIFWSARNNIRNANEAHIGYLGHVLMEHRSGLIVDATVTPADRYGERDAAR